MSNGVLERRGKDTYRKGLKVSDRPERDPCVENTVRTPLEPEKQELRPYVFAVITATERQRWEEARGERGTGRTNADDWGSEGIPEKSECLLLLMRNARQTRTQVEQGCRELGFVIQLKVPLKEMDLATYDARCEGNVPAAHWPYPDIR